MKKKEILEVIDSDNNLIGSKDTPETGGDIESMANRTTDYNASVHGQDFKSDFLGRFGFYFYESEEDASKLKDQLASLMYDKFIETMTYYYEHPDMIQNDYNFQKDKTFADQPEDKKEHDYQWAERIMDIIEPHLKKKLDESKVAEDKIVKDKTDKKKNLKNNKDDDNELSADVKKIADILDKLPKEDKDNLKKIL